MTSHLPGTSVRRIAEAFQCWAVSQFENGELTILITTTFTELQDTAAINPAIACAVNKPCSVDETIICLREIGVGPTTSPGRPRDGPSSTPPPNG